MARQKGSKNKNPKSREDRFWAKVKRSEACWEWIASSINDQGYGSFRDGTGMRSAHRVSWEITHGPIPNGQFVLHKCDNVKCVRPDHLFLGDQAANMKDMAAKGRAGKSPKLGECNPAAKITEAQAREIKRLLALGYHKPVQIAAFMGVSKQIVYHIRSGKSWNGIAV